MITVLRATPLLIAILLWPAHLYAHAQLRSAEPASGAVLSHAPANVVLHFNEPVTPLRSRWFRPDGAAIDVQSQSMGDSLIVTVPIDVLPGTHILSWRVVSADGHPVAGTHVFSVGAPSARPDVAEATRPWPAAIARAVLTIVLVFGPGGILWAALSGQSAGRSARTLAWSCLPAAGLMVATQAMDLAGGGLHVLLSAETWKITVFSPYGLAAILAAIAGLVAAIGAGRQFVVFLAWAVAAMSFAVAGHAARAEPIALMAPLVFVHALALIFWAGALPALFRALRVAEPERQMAKFSRLAVPMVALLVISGAALAVRQVETPTALVGTAYGWILSLKLMLVAVVLLLAVRHRLVLTPMLSTAPRHAGAVFRRSLRLELALMVMILALTAGFRLTPPPRATNDAHTVRVDVHVHGPTAMADIALIPGRPGPNYIEVMPLDGEFRPMRPLAITLHFSRPQDMLEPIEVAAIVAGDGVWRAGPIHLPPGGSWELIADILINDFQKAMLGATVTLPP
ncbi:MAG: copper resistance protein CopC [Nitrospira sp.]|nr:copper resistance protein CopC [Nitrospira sp.]